VAPEEPSDDEDSDAGDDGDGGVGGGDVGPDAAEPRVAGITDGNGDDGRHNPRIGNGGGILKRFPVAGAYGEALLLPGEKRSPWATFALVSALLVLAAYRFDAASRKATLQVSAQAGA
jgi:hypothetical protein